MKILLVRTEKDYEAVDFENVFAGQDVTDLIKQVESGKELIGEAGKLPISIREIPETSLSPELVKFIRNEVQGYEHTKHTNFYLEGDKV